MKKPSLIRNVQGHSYSAVCALCILSVLFFGATYMQKRFPSHVKESASPKFILTEMGWANIESPPIPSGSEGYLEVHAITDSGYMVTTYVSSSVASEDFKKGIGQIRVVRIQQLPKVSGDIPPDPLFLIEEWRQAPPQF